GGSAHSLLRCCARSSDSPASFPWCITSRREPRNLGPAAPACQGRWYLPTLVLLAPVSGPLVPLESVPDPVFAGKLAGDGIAIDPVSSTLLAPCDAEVTSVHSSGHAVTLRA